MEKTTGGRHRRTFAVIDGGAGKEETITPEAFAGSALGSSVDLAHTFNPHPIFDEVQQHNVKAEYPNLRVVVDPETETTEPEVVPGSVAELMALKKNPLASNEEFMEARRRRAAEVAGRRLGMEDEQPGQPELEQPDLHIVLPPDDGLQ